MQLFEVIQLLQSLAPESLAEPWDKVGLHIGDPQQTVRRALLCIDLTEAVLAEAKQGKHDLVVAYHPPIFKPLERVTVEDGKARLVYDAVRAGIAVYSPHTALDAAKGGVNDWLASGFGDLADSRPITPTASRQSVKYTVVTFVPAAKVDAVRNGMAKAGAGQIGDYIACSFNVAGEGTFQGGRASHPAVGKAGRFERVPEIRLEMVCPASWLADVMAAVRATHPYEEPAIDVYRLEAEPTQAKTGAGRVVTLAKPVAIKTLVTRIKQHLGVKHVEVAAVKGGRKVSRIGVCAGAGGSLLEAAGAVDLYLTGEMRHHDVLAAVARGTNIVLAGHTQTERPYLKVYRRNIVAAGAKGVSWTVSRADVAVSAMV